MAHGNELFIRSGMYVNYTTGYLPYAKEKKNTISRHKVVLNERAKSLFFRRGGRGGDISRDLGSITRDGK